MADEFQYDVFLSHSSKDKPIVREIAERLRADGMRVWLDEWAIRPGDSIPFKVEEGLEQSRLLVLCMSANAFASDWALLESQTFRFRDPLNKDRRFLSLRLDDAPVKGSLAQFLYIDWRTSEKDQAYVKLLDTCRPQAELAPEGQVTESITPVSNVYLGSGPLVYNYAFNSDGKRALSVGADKTVRVWDVETGRCLKVMEGHNDSVWSVAWSADQNFALSGSADRTIRVWDVETGRCLRVMEGHDNSFLSVAWSADQNFALSGSSDNIVRVWDVTNIFSKVSEPGLDSLLSTVPEQVQYTNAKVLVVGDTSAGKTGLAHRLATGEWKPSDGSTVGAWSTQWRLPAITQTQDLQQEIWLWDFGGQSDQRLIHNVRSV